VAGAHATAGSRWCQDPPWRCRPTRCPHGAPRGGGGSGGGGHDARERGGCQRPGVAAAGAAAARQRAPGWRAHTPPPAPRGRHTWGHVCGPCRVSGSAARAPRSSGRRPPAAATRAAGGTARPRADQPPLPPRGRPAREGGWPYLGSADRLKAAPPDCLSAPARTCGGRRPSTSRSPPNQWRVDPAVVQGASTHTETDGSGFARAGLDGPQPRSTCGRPRRRCGHGGAVRWSAASVATEPRWWRVRRRRGETLGGAPSSVFLVRRYGH